MSEDRAGEPEFSVIGHQPIGHSFPKVGPPTMTAPIRIAVTGAGGQIGYALIFRIASGGLFGPDQPVALQLLEITPALPALNGTLMELEDCAFPLLASMTATDKAEVAFGGAD